MVKLQMTKAVNKAAKLLVKEFRNGDDRKVIDVLGCAHRRNGNGATEVWCSAGGETAFRVVDMDMEDFSLFTRLIADRVVHLLRMPKSALVIRKEAKSTTYVGWMARELTLADEIIVLKPSKLFREINKKLEKLGCKPIEADRWVCASVAGKRDSIFSEDAQYKAEYDKDCQMVLDYLKGKKKVSYEYKRIEDFEDRKRGIEYETEWYGSYDVRLEFTDAKGKKKVI